MKLIIFLAAILVSLSIVSCSNQEDEEAAVENRGDFGVEMKSRGQLFLLIGQSNMAGRGVISDEDLNPHPRVSALNSNDEWVPAVDPVHFDKPIAGVGPGRTFGIEVAEANPGLEIGLVPAAVGGSPIDSWRPGGFYEETGTYPYDDAIRRAHLAIETGDLKAVLWHQGESDSNPLLAPDYKEKLVELINRLRLEFDNPELPFLIGQLGNFPDSPWTEWHRQVNRAQEEAALEMSNVFFINSEELTDKGDALHFSAEAARELGRRYATVYLQNIR